jgi:hypothetical protein
MTEEIPEKRGPGRPPNREAREGRDETRVEKGRRERIPLGTSRPKLHARVPNGMVGRWVNDTPGRIAEAVQAGYEFINDSGTTGDRGSARTVRVGVNEDGSAMTGYLMAIPEEWHKEDQKAKLKPVYDMERDIRRGNTQGAGAEDAKKVYSDISIESTNRADR